ncbi:MAG: hypothetical protein CMJ06_05700 [Pelagibacterales bacterium]|nr:hypothetical protein [Pelagibacterales bacterium]OUU61418.1 MAG: hypothetical protein CBC22_07765 [Alphaproteobacteria bacterium TMED62]|tara:strand:+ start:18712 stop:19119 length:408 start_codon:yes stop_codon:yes gene_type:complete
MSLAHLSSTINIRIYYEDTDAGGVVYHSRYLNFAERGRAEFLRNLSLKQISISQKYKIHFVVKELKVNYISFCKLDDNIQLLTNLESINRVKLCFKHNFYKNKKEILRMNVTICSVSNTGKVARIPKSLYYNIIN